MGSQLSSMTPASTPKASQTSALVRKPKESTTSLSAIHHLLQRLVLGQTSAASTQPFPFLRLPPELRLMIYEEHVASLTITAQQYFIGLADLNMDPDLHPSWPSHISLIRKSMPGIKLLYTCRQIYTEAYPMFTPLLRELAMEPLRFSANDHAAAVALTCTPSPLIACLGSKLEDTFLISTLTNQARDFIALCQRPSPTYATGDVDIEISFMPTIEAQTAEMLEKALEGVAARAAEGTLRFRITMTSPVRSRGPVRIPDAITNLADKVEVRQLPMSQYIRHFLEQQAMVRD